MTEPGTVNAANALSAVLDALRTVRVPAVLGEHELHGLILAALEAAGIKAVHEAAIAPRCRIDFLCVGCVGVEVKQGEQPRGRLLEQARRYLSSDKLDALVLVTTRGVNLPGSIGGKQLIVFGLNRLWGVALP